VRVKRSDWHRGGGDRKLSLLWRETSACCIPDHWALGGKSGLDGLLPGRALRGRRCTGSVTLVKGVYESARRAYVEVSFVVVGWGGAGIAVVAGVR
jgi:hypothetical protein